MWNFTGRFKFTRTSWCYFIGEDGQKKTPVMLHRALFGSLERFTGILIEHYAGHYLYGYLQYKYVVATITSDSDDYGYEVLKELKSLGI